MRRHPPEVVSLATGRAAAPGTMRAMPTVRPFRALRYEPSRVPDIAAVLCPPYDIISPAEQQALLERDARNAVRLELPTSPDPADADGRYRAAARTLAEWRSDGTLRKDPRASVYVHEMRYREPGSGRERVTRGAMVRLRLAAFGPESDVRPHERTMSGPKEDRYRLLKATGTNLSPIVFVQEDSAAADVIATVTAGAPTVEATDHDGIHHRLWACPTAGEGEPPGAAEALVTAITGRPLTIADGHHRYETALRYREERSKNQACESDPPYDYVLALVYDVADAPALLATHRLIHELPAGGAGLLGAAADLFQVERVADAVDLLARMSRPSAGAGAGGRGRFGVWTQDGGAILTVRRDQMSPLLDAAVPEAARWIDAAVLAAALGPLAGIDAVALVGGERVTYTKDAADAIAQVDEGRADAAFLLDPTPVADVIRVADVGGVMPQKSTYFFPKAPTGLLFNPLEP